MWHEVDFNGEYIKKTVETVWACFWAIGFVSSRYPRLKPWAMVDFRFDIVDAVNLINEANSTKRGKLISFDFIFLH
jgi:hypothetical protein